MNVPRIDARATGPLLIDATAGEINAWSAAWTCTAAWVFVRVLARLESRAGEDRAGDRRGALLWGLVCGAGLAHHLASVLVAVPLTVALAATVARHRRPLASLALLGAVAACVPLASYGFIVWRAWNPAIVFWPDDRYLRLREYQLLGGEKPAVLVLNPNLLVEERTREGLRRRFGVDPLDGHPIPTIVPGSPGEEERIRKYFRQVIRDFNQRIRTPVIIFDPSVPIVQQLRKPWEG